MDENDERERPMIVTLVENGLDDAEAIETAMRAQRDVVEARRESRDTLEILLEEVDASAVVELLKLIVREIAESSRNLDNVSRRQPPQQTQNRKREAFASENETDTSTPTGGPMADEVKADGD